MSETTGPLDPIGRGILWLARDNDIILRKGKIYSGTDCESDASRKRIGWVMSERNRERKGWI